MTVTSKLYSFLIAIVFAVALGLGLYFGLKDRISVVELSSPVLPLGAVTAQTQNKICFRPNTNVELDLETINFIADKFQIDPSCRYTVDIDSVPVVINPPLNPQNIVENCAYVYSNVFTTGNKKTVFNANVKKELVNDNTVKSIGKFVYDHYKKDEYFLFFSYKVPREGIPTGLYEIAIMIGNVNTAQREEAVNSSATSNAVIASSGATLKKLRAFCP